MRRGEVFATTDHCGAIEIKKDEISPEYLRFELDSIKHEYGFDRNLRASLKNMSNVKVKIPINKSGAFDKDTQQLIASKYETIDNIKRELSDKVQEMLEAKVQI